MPKSPKVDVGDNAQVAVDAKQQLCVVPEGTHAVPDGQQLSGLAIQAQEALEAEPRTVGADKGSYHGEEITACEEAGMEPYGAKPLTSANRKGGRYGKDPFTYKPESDCYRGPAGQALPCRFAPVEWGRQIRS
jgi:hypothetical protein